MKMVNKILSCILILIVVISIFPLNVFAENDVIKINSLDDYYKLASESKSDVYTKGKTYVLKTDLDFTGKEFVPIGVFNGSFDGENHTIKGINEKEAKSKFGLFREIGVDGVVKNLNVEIDIKGASIGENIGGLVGISYGEIRGVHVQGTIKGIKNLGGVVGANYGDIYESSFNGIVKGEHTIGGISGYNEGGIFDCKAEGKINCEYIEVTTYEISIISYLPTQLTKLLLPEEVVGVTDVGGICGYSSGVISGCTNYSEVGYQKTGSNIGGIVGRTNKYLFNCNNYGNIYGKNDVGGIVGQIIPFTKWELAESKLTLISNSLNKLKSDIDSLLEKVDVYSSDVSENIVGITNQMDKVETNLDEFLKSGEEWVDSSVYKVNELSTRISYAIDTLASASTSLDNVTSHVSKSLDYIEQASRSADDIVEYYDRKTDVLIGLVSNIQTNIENLSKLTQKFVDIYNNGLEAVQTVEDTRELYENLFSIFEGAYSLFKMLYGFSSSLIDFYNNNKLLISISLAALLFALNSTLENTVKNFEKIIGLGVDSIEIQISTVVDINDTIMSIVPILESIANEIDVMEQSSEYASDILTSFANAAHELSQGIKNFGYVVSSVDSIFPYLSSQGTIKFDYIKTYVSKSQTEFFDSLEVLNDKLRELSTRIDDQELKDNVKDVSNSFFELSNDIIDCLNDLKNIQNRTIVESVNYSYDDIDTNPDFAIVYRCINKGLISGETNIGGICGIINIDVENIESALNLEGLLISGSKYIISATIQESKNYSHVISSKDNVGGIVGNQKYGLVIDSISESFIETNGNYAGGIVGNSEAKIKDSKSRSSISGISYLGGIVGKGKNLENNISVCDMVSGKEYLGAIAGFCDGTIIENVYGVYYYGGIDALDYENKATYDASDNFIDNSGLTNEVTITYVSDNGEISYNIPYNTKITDIPEIENSGDMYWAWNDVPSGNVKCNTTIYGTYKKPKTTISTGEEIPDVLVEGSFYNDNVLYVENVTSDKYSTSTKGSFIKKISVSSYSGNIRVRTKVESAGSLYLLNGNETQKLNYSKEGSYLVFDIENGSTIYFKGYESNAQLIFVYIAIGVVALAGIIVLVVLLVRHNRKKKQLQTSEEQTNT